jgi:acetylornithine deacetylase/succinyl-diaminopimelate desuccinylase-like protein
VINVPSVDGVCHHPSEFTSPEDLELGTEILARMLRRLCEEGLGVLETAA